MMDRPEAPDMDKSSDAGSMSNEDLAAILQREYEAADQYHSQLSEYDQQAFKYYEGQPFGNEVEGRSQIVLPDVQETIDYMAQSVLRTFVSGDRTVEFEAVDEDDEEAVAEATAAINYNFMRKQDGYRILHDGLNDGLLKKRGVFKTVMETVERISCRKVRVDPVMLGMLPDGVEVEDEVDNGDGTVTATLKTERIEKQFTDYAIPTTEFRFSPSARHEDEADYLCHVCEKTRSDLVEMGFDRDQVAGLPGYTRDLSVTPATSERLDGFFSEDSTAALEKVLLCEEYARIDLDDDGIAERVKIYRVGRDILIDGETGEPSIETVDEQPFAVFCPFPRSHKMIGYSLADKVMDLQLARSFVARQLFDGMALANMPRPIVDVNGMTDDTINDILTPIPGSPIRVKGGAAAVQPLQTGFDVGKSLQVMEWATGERESRTGITRLNQGLDADALNKTATGTALMQAQGQQNEEFVARNLAETLGRLFAKKYRLMRAESDPFKVKVDGAYKTVDPSAWPEDINVIVRVGLGSGNKDKRIAHYMQLMEPMAEGFANGLVTAKHTFKLMDKMVRDMGIGQGDDFWVDPDQPELGPDGQPVQKQEKPDPQAMALQAEQQREDAKLQMEQQNTAAKLDLQRQTTEATLQLQQQKDAATVGAMREKHALEMDQKREAAALEAQLAQDRADREFQLALYQIEREAEVAKHSATIKADAALSANRPGGDLDK